MTILIVIVMLLAMILFIAWIKLVRKVKISNLAVWKKSMIDFINNIQYCYPIHHGFRIMGQQDYIFLCLCSPPLPGWAKYRNLLSDMRRKKHTICKVKQYDPNGLLVHLKRLTESCFYHKVAYTYIVNLFCHVNKKSPVWRCWSLPLSRFDKQCSPHCSTSFTAVAHCCVITYAWTWNSSGGKFWKNGINAPASQLLPVVPSAQFLLPSELLQGSYRVEERVYERATINDSGIPIFETDNVDIFIPTPEEEKHIKNCDNTKVVKTSQQLKT